MEADLLLTLSCLFGFIAMSVAGRVFFLSLQRVLAASVQSESFDSAASGMDARSKARSVLSYVLRNGIPFCSRAGDWLAGHRVLGKRFNEAALLAQRRGFPSSACSLASAFVAALCVAACVCAAVSRSLLAGLLSVPLFVLTASALLSREKDRERAALREQVPDALRCMEACLHAGLSLPQAFAEVAFEIPSPAKERFEQVSHDLELGYSMEEALEHFHRVSALPELGFVAMALDVQHACGGSATPILRSAEDSVASGLELQRLLDVQTAQARLSAQIVSIMPFLLLAMISAMNPGFLAPFFADARGVVLFVLALSMQAVGVALVRRALAIDL